MRITRRFIEEDNFLLTKISGTLNDQRLMKYLTLLNRNAQRLTACKQLVDCRGVSCMNDISVRGTTEYAKQEPTQQEDLLALLIPNGPLSFGMARVYQTFATEKRRAVQIFCDFDQAKAWLENPII